MRRLPIFLLLDCSESMAGESLEAVENGVVTMLSALKRNPYTLELAHLSVITFAAKAKVEHPLMDLASIKPPKLSPRPGTSLGAALDALRESITKEIVKTTSEKKGDYKPLVFILTDGYPTDDWQGPLKRLKAACPYLASICAIGVGEEIDFETLGQIADECFHFKELSATSLAKFFLWMTASIQSHSLSPDGKVSLEKPSLTDGMELVDKNNPPKFSGKDQRIYLHVTCRKSRKLFMMTYKRNPGLSTYNFVASTKLPEDFFADGTMKSPPIDASKLYGIAGCPYCGSLSWSNCASCGHLLCVDIKQGTWIEKCPVCGASLAFSMSNDGGSFFVDGSMG